MPSYAYTNGDGLAVIIATLPDGAVEPVSNLDDALKQVKAYLVDPTAGVSKIQTDVTATVATVATHTTSIASLTTASTTAATNITTLQTTTASQGARITALEAAAGTVITPITFIVNPLASQTIVAGAGYTLVNFNSATLNSGNGFATGTGKFTAPQAGFYQFFATMKTFTSASSAPTAIRHFLSIFKNAVRFATMEVAAADTTGAVLAITRNMQLAASDVIDIRYQLTVGSGTMSSDTTIASESSEFSGILASA